MKTRLTILKHLIILCCAFATTAVFGQVVKTWTNNFGGLITTAANWDPNTLPDGNDGSSLQQTALWDSRTTQDMIITNTTATLPNTGFSTIGINITLDSTYANNLQFVSTVADPGNSGQIGLNFVTNNSPNASLTFGDFTATRMRLTGRPAGAIHYWVNNSTAPLIINPSAEWQAGGGTAYTMEFSGTGNWDIRNSLRTDNGGGGVSIVLDGPGSMTWTNGTTFIPANDNINTVTVNAGTLTFSRNLLTAGLNGNGAITINGGSLVFKTALPSDADTISRSVTGASPGVLEINNGTLTLSSGSSTFSGNINLTGGKLVAGGAENPGTSGPLGLGGTISFLGGTLGYSVNNVFDYSGRFATAGQAYSIDTGGQSVTYTNSIGLSGAGNTLTKLGNGTLTLAGGSSTYSGLTTVSLGKLVFQSAKTGNGNITVADGAALGVFNTGTPVGPNSLTVGTGSSATLEFNNVTSITTPLMAVVNGISVGGPITVNVNSGTLVPGSNYPLFSWGTGAAPAVSLGILNGFIGTLSTNGSTIQLNVTATAYKWSGNNNSNWDTATPNNWVQNGGPVVYGANGPGPAIFDDSASGNPIVTINSPVSATLVTFNNANTNYTIASSGANNLGGSTPVLQAGSGTTTLSGGANTYTGVTTLSGGTLSVGALASGGSASDIGQSGSGAANLVFNSGTLQYTGGGATIDRLFTLGTSGGTLDASGTAALAFLNSGALGYSGNGPRTLILTGTDTDTNTLAAPLANNGGTTSLTKNGTGNWILTGNSTSSGVTTIANGTLQIGSGGATGSPGTGNINNSGTLDFNRTGSLTINGAITGTGTVVNDGTGTVILAADNNYGTTTINAGTVQVGNGGGTGKLNGNAQIVDNGTLIFNSTGGLTLSANISGTGQLIKRGSGLLVLRGGGVTYSFSGGMTIDAGAQLQLFQGNEASYTGGSITNNGTLFMVRQDPATAIVSQNISGNGIVVREGNNDNTGDVTFTGTNTYGATNVFSTIIKSGGIVLGDNSVTPFGGSITGNVQFANGNVSTLPDRYITFNRAEDYTFSGNIVGAVTNVGTAVGQVNPANAGRLIQSGSGTLTLTGTNTYPFGTTISAGTVAVGAGGTRGTIGTGNVTFTGGILVWNRSDDVTFGGAITGAGSFVKMAADTLTLTSTNLSLTGPTVVSNGTLLVTGQVANGIVAVGGDVNVEGGTLIPGGVGTVVTMNAGGGMNIDSGTVSVSLNRILASSVTNFSVTGTINSTGGTLKLLNAGPALQAGDKFYIFSGPVTGGAGVTIVSPGLTVANNLATDGSVTVTAALPPPTITATVSGGGGQLNLSWPAAWIGGVHLQSQTNLITKGLSTNWVTIPGTDASNSYLTTINTTNGCVFYRLITP